MIHWTRWPFLRHVLPFVPYGPSPWTLTRNLLVRGLGLVFAIAFTSLWVQIDGLLGSDGVLPAAEVYRAQLELAGADAVAAQPTLFWLAPSDLTLHALCAAGVVGAVGMMVGLLPAPSLVVCWVAYVSLRNAAFGFLHYQWDGLLLETALLSLLVTPWTVWLDRASGPAPIGWFVLRILLFKLMFLAGWVKLASGDPTWADGTAMTYHYWTQPLPNPLSLWMNGLPLGFHKASVTLTLAVELGLPFLIASTRTARVIAFAGFAGLMAMLALTGNYGFFQLLTVVLALCLLDDRVIEAVTGPLLAHVPRIRPVRWRTLVGPFVLTPWALVLGAACAAWVPLTMQWYDGDELSPGLLALTRPFAPFGTVNSYGLFAVMTTERPEILFRGSADGHTWRVYPNRYQPTDPTRPPPAIPGHMPRLDWQLWFAALTADAAPGHTCVRYPEVEGVQRALLRGSPAVVGLFAEDPFAGEPPPRYVQAALYRYEPAPAGADAYWTAERVGLACPTLAR